MSLKIDSEPVAEAIWGRKAGDALNRTWQLMWFFDSLVELNADPEVVRRGVQREDNARFQNFSHVRPDAERALRLRYGSIEGFVENIAQAVPDLPALVESTAGGASASHGTALDDAMSLLDETKFLRAVNALTKSLPAADRRQTRRVLRRRYGVRNWLKKLYEDRCQVCGFRFQKRSGGYYSEGAHLRRVSLRLPDLDVVQNMVILCADHHKMVDHGFMRIEWDDVKGKLIARKTEHGDVEMTNKHLGVDADGNFICTMSSAP